MKLQQLYLLWAGIFLVGLTSQSCSKDESSGNPELILSPTSFHIAPENLNMVKLGVRNSGGEAVSWQVVSKPSWLLIEPASGILLKEVTDVYLGVLNQAELEGGTYEGEVVIESAQARSATLAVSYTRPDYPSLAVNVPELEFGYLESSKQVTLTNSGNVPLTWTLDLGNSPFVASVSQGTLQRGESVQIDLSANRENLETGVTNYVLQFSANQGEAIELPVRLKNYNEAQWTLEGTLVDAHFNRAGNQLIAVTQNPNRIQRLDMESQTAVSLDLNLAPKCLSISPDGASAAVGHNGKVSYVDLNAMSLIQLYDLAADAFDILLGPGGWVYVFPESGQHTYIHSLELASGAESTTYGIYERTHAVLHPDGTVAYGADTNLSPSDFEKYDLSGGVAAYLYDSQYHGEYEFSGNIWINESGTRLFAASGKVFTSSTAANQDILYAGALENTAFITHLDQSDSAGKICVMVGEGTPYFPTLTSVMRIFDSEFYTQQGADIDLPPFFQATSGTDGTLVTGKGKFGFLNTAGNRVIALLVPDSGSGLSGWSVVTVPIE